MEYWIRMVTGIVMEQGPRIGIVMECGRILRRNCLAQLPTFVLKIF